MKIKKIISEYKRIKTNRIAVDKYGKVKSVIIPRPRAGYKRVEAIVEEDGLLVTRHIDIPK